MAESLFNKLQKLPVADKYSKVKFKLAPKESKSSLLIKLEKILIGLKF